MNMIFKNKDVKVIILEVFLIALGLVGLTLGVKYIMNSINVNVDTSKLAIDSMNANVTNGTLTPINDSTVNINTTSNVLRITFDVKGASTNTGSNIIYDVLLNLTADCSLKNESVKWNLYKNNNLLTSGSTSPKYDKDVLKGKIMLTDIQQDLVPYSKTADKYVFILWMSESCNEEDITKCDISKGLTSDSGGKSISGNIDIRLNSGKKKENNRDTANITNVCEEIKATYIIEHLDDESTGDSGSGVYKITHSEIPASSSVTGKEIPSVTDYRYYGANPNNYICLDMEGSNTCPDKHLYRIIGSIYEELEGTNRLKVIKAIPLENKNQNGFSWGETTIGIYNNIWIVTDKSYNITEKSIIMELLNNGDWWNDANDFQGYGLTKEIRKYISSSRYYLGGVDNSSTADSLHSKERGTDKIYDNVPLYWDGMVGLMYPSDYGYAAGNECATNVSLGEYNIFCKSKDWLYNTCAWQWLMSPGVITEETQLFQINFLSKNGSLYNGYFISITDKASITTKKCAINISNRARVVTDSGYVFPTFYLDKDVLITDGTGTVTDPYLLG